VVVATAFLMERLDATIITAAVPDMAASLRQLGVSFGVSLGAMRRRASRAAAEP
jgi:hypothetical protein